MANQYTAKTPLKQRLLRGAIRTENGCLLFRATSPEGYGTIGDENNRSTMAHQASYRVFKGEVPDGLVIDHLCRVRRCIEPSHLEAVTQKTNVLRSPYTTASINKIKTHCPVGHEYTDDNTIRDPKPNSISRACRACVNNRKRIKRAKMKMGI